MKTRLNFTKAALDALPAPAAGQRVTYHDEGGPQSVNGLQLRVTSAGTKTFYIFQRVNGKPERVKVGEHPYPLTGIELARKLAKGLISQIAEGKSPAAAKRERAVSGMTVAEAFTAYTERKQRVDDLPLKPRTVADYIALVRAPRLTAAGKRTKGGLLAPLADKPIRALTAGEIRDLHHANLAARGGRQSSFAMMALKAVLRFHGIQIAHSPFAPTTPEAERVRIRKPGVSDREPIRLLAARLGEFWRVVPATIEGDYLRFLLLTGCRPNEPLKLIVGDLAEGVVTLRDTKNRRDHTLYLSRQALSIIKRNSAGKAPTDRIFPIAPARVNKVVHVLAAELRIDFKAKTLRAVFASTAERLVSFSVLRALMNHKEKADVTNTNYVEKSKAELRAGWQAVADFIENSDNVVQLRA